MATDGIEKIFAEKLFDVEHALNMYALNYVNLQAAWIYDDNIISEYINIIKNCHIYIIGLLPKIEFVGARQDGSNMYTLFKVRDREIDICWPLPEGSVLQHTNDDMSYILLKDGGKVFPSQEHIVSRLRAIADINFKVLYIGQAYGDDGSRNAIDRLKKHETLQKISLKGIPGDDILSLLLLQVEPNNRIITLFNPWAKNQEEGDSRIDAGLNKLFNTSEAERTTLYEASLIRYFMPEFNKEFKNSFPSTNMKLLADCYSKDINAVNAEINFEDLPFMLYRDFVDPKTYHIAHHDLHKDEQRRVFFFDAPEI